MLSRTVLSILFIAMIAPVAANQSNILPASNTTITSLETTTIAQTISSSYAVDTSYQTFTTTDTIYSSTIHLTGPGDGYCSLKSITFSGSKGQHLVVQLQSPIAFYFFVLTEASFQKWSQQRYCDVKVPAVDKQKEIKTYSKDLVLPTDGDYRFLFELWDTNDSTDVQLTASIYPTIVTSTSTIYTVTAETRSSAVSRSSLIVQTVQEPMSIGGAPPEVTWLIIGIILIVIAVGAFLALRRRTGEKVKGLAATGVGSGQFCMNCGTELLRNAEFCRKCGTPVSKA